MEMPHFPNYYQSKWRIDWIGIYNDRWVSAEQHKKSIFFNLFQFHRIIF